MIGVISDIHGNYPALKAVLGELDRYGCEKIISLGDVAGYYCDINECIDLLREKNVVNILGNHDYYLISNGGCPRSRSANICLEYQKRNITNENMKWLENSKKYIDTDCISYRHGGWNNEMDEYVYDFSFNMVKSRKQKIYISGHTHKQIMMSENGYVYFNPGSVGQPRDYSSSAAFAIIDEKRNYDIKLLRVEYEINNIINKMRELGFPEYISDCLLYGTKIGETV